MSLTRLTHELVSLFALATARKLYFLTTEYLFEAGTDTSVFAWHSTQSDAVSDSNDVNIQPILSNRCRSWCWDRNNENGKLDLCRNFSYILQEAHSEWFLFYRSFLWARTDQPALKSQVFLQKPATGWGTIVRLNEPYLYGEVWPMIVLHPVVFLEGTCPPLNLPCPCLCAVVSCLMAIAND